MIEQYVAHRLVMGEITESTATVIRVVLGVWHRHAGPIEGWTSELAGAWVHDDRFRPSYRKSRLGKLRPYVRWLIAQGHLDHDPTSGVAKVVIPKGDPRDLEPAEVSRLLDACPDRRALLIVILMVQMGLRCGDVARIRVEDIDTRRRMLHVRAKGGRGGHTHWVPIPDEAWDLTVQWVRDLHRSAGPVVVSYLDNNSAVSAHHISHLVGEWVKAAGLKTMPRDGVSAHALRHTCAQHMRAEGAEVRHIQKALGHTDPRTTEGYLRGEEPGLRAAVEGRSYLRAA